VLDRARKEYGEGSPQFEVYVKKIGQPRVFGIDSKDALTSRLTSDNALWRRSGFAQFLLALEEFLSRFRGTTTLQVPVNRLIASGNEIIAVVELRENSLTMGAEEFQEKCGKAEAELQELLERKAKELKEIDKRMFETRLAALKKLEGLNERVTRAAETAINGAIIKDEDVANKETVKKTTERVQGLVMKAMRQELERCCEQVDQEVGKGIAEASAQLEEFINEVDRTIRAINADFSRVEERAGEAMIGVLAVYTGFGGIWAGYKQAGIVGALVGGAGSAAAIFGLGLVLGLVGLPLTLPVFIAGMLAAWWSGGKVTELMFSGKKGEHVQANLRAEILKEIEKRDFEVQLQSQVKGYVDDAFAAYKSKISTEVDATVNDTHRTLTNLKEQWGKEEARFQAVAGRFTEIRKRTQAIQNYSIRLNEALIKVLSV